MEEVIITNVLYIRDEQNTLGEENIRNLLEKFGNIKEISFPNQYEGKYPDAIRVEFSDINSFKIAYTTLTEIFKTHPYIYETVHIFLEENSPFEKMSFPIPRIENLKIVIDYIDSHLNISDPLAEENTLKEKYELKNAKKQTKKRHLANLRYKALLDQVRRVEKAYYKYIKDNDQMENHNKHNQKNEVDYYSEWIADPDGWKSEYEIQRNEEEKKDRALVEKNFHIWKNPIVDIFQGLDMNHIKALRMRIGELYEQEFLSPIPSPSLYEEIVRRFLFDEEGMVNGEKPNIFRWITPQTRTIISNDPGFIQRFKGYISTLGYSETEIEQKTLGWLVRLDPLISLWKEYESSNIQDFSQLFYKIVGFIWVAQEVAIWEKNLCQ